MLDSVVNGALGGQEFFLHLNVFPIRFDPLLKMNGISKRRARRVVLSLFLVKVFSFRLHLFP